MSRFLVAIFFFSSVVLGCASGPTARNWRESNYPKHEYKEVAEITRAVLMDTFKFKPLEWRWYKDDGVITFETEWNATLSTGTGFSGTPKRYKVFVECQEVALDLFGDDSRPRFQSSLKGENKDDQNIDRIEERNGVPKRIVTQLAIAVEEEVNISTQPDNPAEAQWRSQGDSEEMYYRILGKLKEVVSKTGGRTIDISPQVKNAHDKYFKSADLTPEEREAKYHELEKRPWRDQPAPKE